MVNTHCLKRTFAVLVIGLAVSGCVTTKPESSQELLSASEKAQAAALNAQIDAALQRVADQPRWSSSLEDRAAFASFNTNEVSVSYQGSAADLLTAIAASRGKTFKITGPSPRIPVFVFVETKNQPFEDFLRDLNKQFGGRADVVLGDHHLELRYR